MSDDTVNVHAARRFLRRVVTNSDVRSITLIHPLQANKIDQIFSPRYYTISKKKVTYYPTASQERREALLYAAQRAGVVAGRATSSTPTKKKTTTKRAKSRITLAALEKRVRKLEEQRTALDKNVKELTKKRVEPLENVVEGVEKQVSSLDSVHASMKKNFAHAEKVVLRDERMLKRLRDDVKKNIKPLVKATASEVAELRHRLDKLEALYATYAKIGSADPERLKTLGERIVLTKRQLQKLEGK